MTEVKLYKTPAKALKIFALTIPLLAIGIWLITKADSSTAERVMSWVMVLFFGLGIPVGLFHLFDRRPQIIVTEDGIWDRTTNQDEVQWEQIQKAYALDISGQKFISLVVNDTFVFKRKQHKWAAMMHRAVGAQKLNLHMGQLKMDADKMISFIEEMIEAEKDKRQYVIKKYFYK